MPTYEYVCAGCGHEFELFQKMTDPPAKKCPECKGKVKRKIGAGAGLIFKGSGFYITDYRSEGYKKAAAAESGKSSEPKPDAAKSGGASSGESKSGTADASKAGKPAGPAGGGAASRAPESGSKRKKGSGTGTKSAS